MFPKNDHLETKNTLHARTGISLNDFVKKIRNIF